MQYAIIYQVNKTICMYLPYENKCYGAYMVRIEKDIDHREWE